MCPQAHPSSPNSPRSLQGEEGAGDDDLNDNIYDLTPGGLS